MRKNVEKGCEFNDAMERTPSFMPLVQHDMQESEKGEGEKIMDNETRDLLIIIGILLAIGISAYGLLWFSGETACQNICQEHYTGKFSIPPIYGGYPPQWKCETKNAIIDSEYIENKDAEGWDEGYKRIPLNYCGSR